MSMSALIVEFEKNQENLINSEYNELSKKIRINEEIDEILSEYLEEFITYEGELKNEDEEVSYKIVEVEKLKPLSDTVNKMLEKTRNEYHLIKGKSEKKILFQRIESMIDINFLIKEILFNLYRNKETKLIKFIVA